MRRLYLVTRDLHLYLGLFLSPDQRVGLEKWLTGRNLELLRPAPGSNAS